MKKLLILVPLLCLSFTNVLTLEWVQPPGYQSTLYQATNVNGNWVVLAVTNPPVSLLTTQNAAFFWVSVAPTNRMNPIMSYDNDPIDEGVVPPYPDLQAFCYSTNGNWQGLAMWNPYLHEWQ